MHYRLLRLSFGKGKSASFHAIAPSLIDNNMLSILAYNRYSYPLNAYLSVWDVTR